MVVRCSRVPRLARLKLYHCSQEPAPHGSQWLQELIWVVRKTKQKTKVQLLAIGVHNDVAVASRCLRIWGTKDLASFSAFQKFFTLVGREFFWQLFVCSCINMVAFNSKGRLLNSAILQLKEISNLAIGLLGIISLGHPMRGRVRRTTWSTLQSLVVNIRK